MHLHFEWLFPNITCASSASGGLNRGGVWGVDWMGKGLPLAKKSGKIIAVDHLKKELKTHCHIEGFR